MKTEMDAVKDNQANDGKREKKGERQPERNGERNTDTGGRDRQKDNEKIRQGCTMRRQRWRIRQKEED